MRIFRLLPTVPVPISPSLGLSQENLLFGPRKVYEKPIFERTRLLEEDKRFSLSKMRQTVFPPQPCFQVSSPRLGRFLLLVTTTTKAKIPLYRFSESRGREKQVSFVSFPFPFSSLFSFVSFPFSSTLLRFPGSIASSD